ncbi:hypothetical protein FGO68_gene12066 [Halteria grandinella]|uniref:Uncharacterized protein n=1 Tax=Halteria grandinella TaxID=5974 RepID=A0A8J8NSN1_HALGN|nr:hypothetical protein FGO68_gene12066 [Halteria grandinella]
MNHSQTIRRKQRIERLQLIRTAIAGFELIYRQSILNQSLIWVNNKRSPRTHNIFKQSCLANDEIVR